MESILNNISFPEDIKNLSQAELVKLSDEIRAFIIDKVSKTGGHLSSNLGVVELTLAIHSVYDTPHDKIIWDVGHQTYIHKILTNRKEGFDNLRRYEGLSGFPKKNESIYDVFETGHSSTSISAALGISRARDIKNENYNVVAVIGDGALTGGMAFEALNDAGASNINMTVILNDNQMSIAPNVGSLSTYLSKLRTEPAYFRFKTDFQNIMKSIPGIGSNMANAAEKIKHSLKYLFVPGMLFEDLGFTYLGPVDGHDISMLKYVLERSKKIKGPVLIHIITTKGKGYDFAEKSPDRYHGVGAFDVDTGELLGKKFTTYSDVFSEEIVSIADEDNKVIAITAAMPEGTGLENFSKKYPCRFFDVGIAEQHAVTLAAGLASNGMHPVFAVYSTFLQRAYDQILHDVCIQNLPVVFAIDRAGIVGEDGETHQGIFDIAYLRHIPNIVIMSPKSVFELRKMLRTALKLNCPVAIRYPRGSDIEDVRYDVDNDIHPFKSEVLSEGKDLLIIAVGRMVGYAQKAVDTLKKSGVNIGLINARFIKPLDKDTLLRYIKKYKSILTLEDGIKNGGFGSSILELLSENNINNVRIKIMGFPDEFITQGHYSILFKKYKLDTDGIIETILKLI